MKRVNIRMSERIWDGYKQLASRYGIPTSYLMVYVLGHWLDTQTEMTEKILDKFSKYMTEVGVEQFKDKL